MDIIRETKNKPYVIAISGVKNSGKTTFIEKLIPVLKNAKYTVATIKHDGHDFECDVEGTDSYRHRYSGADGVAIYSNTKYMMIQQQNNITEELLLEQFKVFDIVILEGFKFSTYPKIELVRKGNSDKSICKKETILAIATDIESLEFDGRKIHIDDVETVADIIKEQIMRL